MKKEKKKKVEREGDGKLVRISWAVVDFIEGKSTSMKDSYDSVLRRLLGLPEKDDKK